MIVLASDELLARLDPLHGAEVLDLVHLPTGRQLLGRPPFATDPPRPGDLDEPTWTRSYRGGWQLVTPNAGNACEVDGVRHGFHGRASNDPWTVAAVTLSTADLTWQGHGLEVERRLGVEGDVLRVETSMRSLGERVPLVAVEHLSVGLELLEPEVEIELPGGVAYELSETEGPALAPAVASTWPEVLLRDGSVERADRWLLREPRSRFLVVAELPEGRALVRNARTGMSLQLAWDADWLRHAWLWHEVRTYGDVWREQAEILVVEPASVPHGLGLAEAIERGQARWLDPDDSISYSLSVRAAVT